MSMNCLDAAEQVLRKAGRPLHYKEITKRILSEGLWSTDGKTPDATVNAQLSADIKKKRERSRFINPNSGRGEYGLRDAAKFPVTSPAFKPVLSGLRSVRSSRKGLTDLEKEVEKVCKDYSENQNESDVRRFAVEPILKRLGWDSPKVMKTELPVGPEVKRKKETVDIALRCRRKNQVMIEVKFGLLSSSHREQLRKYCRLEEVSLGVLTNGQVWELYYGMNTRMKDNRAGVMDIKQIDSHIAGRWMEKFLSRENIENGEAKKAFRTAREQRLKAPRWDRALQGRWGEVLRHLESQLTDTLEKSVQSSGQTIPRSAVQEFVQKKISHQKQAAPDAERSVAERALSGQRIGQGKRPPRRSSSYIRPVPVTRPEVIRVFGKQLAVASWREITRVFLSGAYGQKPKEFLAMAESQPEKFPISGTEPTSMRSPLQIGASGVWVEGHGSGQRHWGVCERVRVDLGFPEDVLTPR